LNIFPRQQDGVAGPVLSIGDIVNLIVVRSSPDRRMVRILKEANLSPAGKLMKNKNDKPYHPIRSPFHSFFSHYGLVRQLLIHSEK